MRQLVFYLGIIAATLVPLFNIPLILKIRDNRSSKDISLVWTIGVWICALLMLPQALLSLDFSYKIFGTVNFVLFTCVVFFVFRYRKSAS